MDKNDPKLPAKSTSVEVEAFLRQVNAMPALQSAGARGRLIFAMDATASREPAWDNACRIQGEMFAQTETLGGLDIKLVHYGGFGEFDATGWLADSASLIGRMADVRCCGGQTQIASVLRHSLVETRRQRVNALVFVGDCMEEGEDEIVALAGELGLLGVPAFMFHEGGDPAAARTFQAVARLTRGAYCHFDAASAKQLRDLLAAVAVFAAGGRRALTDFSRSRGGPVPLIARQIG